MAAKRNALGYVSPKKYKEALYKKIPSSSFGRKLTDAFPSLTDLDTRFRIMDKYEGLVQVLTLASPPIQDVVGPKDAVELAQIANDQMAELVVKYPDKFVGAVASLPMNDTNATLKEVDRTMTELKFRGIQIFSDVNGKPLNSPEFMLLYEKISRYDPPIWLHPRRANTVPDYPQENESKYKIFLIFGWPYETTAARTRLVFSGTLDKFPNLKIITHHCGARCPILQSESGRQLKGMRHAWTLNIESTSPSGVPPILVPPRMRDFPLFPLVV